MGSDASTRTIVLFSARYLPSVGGVEFFTANLGRQLASMGYDVMVVTTEQANDPSSDSRQQVGSGTFEVLRLDSWGPTRMPFARKSRHNRVVLDRIRRLDDFHALINTRFYDLSRIAVSLCKKKGVKPVLIDHGTGYIRFPSAALSLASKTAEHVITANLKRYPVDYYGVSKDASQWLGNFGISSYGEIHNALDATSFVEHQSGRDFRAEYAVEEGVLCVTFAARLLEEKGADTIVDAARKLKGERRLHFFVAGRGPMEEVVSKASEELPNLTYVGTLDHPDLAALLLEGDVFCLPTRYSEGLPTSLLEAGACSSALVASRAGGVGEIIPDREHGIILESPTSDHVVEALLELAADPSHVDLLKQNAHRRICECFTWESTAREVLAAFEKSNQ